MRVPLRSSASASQIVLLLTVERQDFDKPAVGGMTEERKLKVTVSTLDRSHDETEHRSPTPTRYIVDSEGVTPARGQSTPMSRLELGLQLQRRTWVKRARVETSEIMSALLQFSNVRFAVIRLSSAKGSPERLVLAYPNEETLRCLIADTSIVGLGFSSREEAACAAGAAVTNGATPCQADGVAGSHAEERPMHHLREQLAYRMKLSPICRLATTIVQLGIAAAIFIFYSKNILSATVRAVLTGSV